MKTFNLPDLGEGLKEAEIVEWQVEEGEEVAIDQVIVVVETAKAIVELPSPVAGVVSKICADAGDTISVGQPLLEYEAEHVKSVSVVGELSEASESQDSIERESFEIGGSDASIAHSPGDSIPIKAIAPDVLAFARSLGVEHRLGDFAIEAVTKELVGKIYEEQAKASPCSAEITASKNPMIPLKGTKKIMAQAMIKSHQHVPAVTLFDDAHIGHWEGQDITSRSVRAIVAACEKVPLLNAWFDEESMSIQFFDDINIGIAVNSNEGLFVPVLRSAQDVDPSVVRKLVDKMVRDVQKRSIKPQKLLGATISLSNFGTLSGRYATPIIVPPQVAIVGVGRLRKEPVVKEEKVAVENVLPLSLSFDHRAATGAEAAEFMAALIDDLELVC